MASEFVPGVSVAVVRGADTLLLKGYGSVDLEWDVATPEDGAASYEIGSMTKQFTAAAVLLLAEEGKLDLAADMTEYLPDFDTQGHRVPVARLLDHTSGIKGYTEMPVFGEIAIRNLPRDSLVSLIEAEPFEFEPGTARIYNNSAFFLLGLIIEEASGESYEDFIQERLFEPLGMEDSYYCSSLAVREGRAHGYDRGPNGLTRKRYLEHLWPYAAGSLCSTVGDLVRWNQALHGGEVLTPESYDAMITPMPLNDGTPSRYAMGLGVTDHRGRRSIAHGGGINGFVSDGRYFPDDRLIVIALQNSTGANVGALGADLAELVLGPLPEPEPEAVAYDGDLSLLAGEYTGPARGRPLTITVAVEDGRLAFMLPGQQEAQYPAHVGDGVWQDGTTRVWFDWEDGEVVALRFDTPGAHSVLRQAGG